MQTNQASECGGKRKDESLLESSVEQGLVTVVTAVFNAASTLEATIQSVLSQTYRNIEYVIIDGGSTDGTLEIIEKYDHAIDYWVSEADRGVYDAMNKGIEASSGTWLNFLNANDTFFDASTIETIASMYFTKPTRFVYSDVMFRTGKRKLERFECDHKRMIVHHQASVYKKELHREYGLYLVAPGLTISDYLFFSLIDQANYIKAEAPIAIYDTSGMSQSQKSIEQKFIVDYLVNGMPKCKFVIYFELYYYYRKAKEALRHLWR